ncbi:MAG: ACT domain-containing protein [Candidatus Lokiarchaeota archaeon]|nr:ACT domain-containing protein [Candidatus Lokiarchaeota archaeon]MBD3201820.1 ACT domain-containing protein [Candidatus Lokiarchaeota archaeon]
MKAIVSVVGMDKPGIVATVSTVLADNQVNITDISQSYAQEFFTMIMVVEFDKNKVSLKELSEKLKEAGEEIGVFVSIQHEDVFRAMHRI